MFGGGVKPACPVSSCGPQSPRPSKGAAEAECRGPGGLRVSVRNAMVSGRFLLWSLILKAFHAGPTP